MKKRHKIDKDLVFYIPGHPGAVFTYKAGFTVNDSDIKIMREHLKLDTGHNIGWIEDRRLSDRPLEWSDLKGEDSQDIVYI